MAMIYNPARRAQDDEGFLLVGLIVAIFLILLTLSIAAPRLAQDLKRERELETAHRANQYVRAIQLYYRKFGHYPGSIDQLKNSNNQKFLRQEYADPFTGKADWRLIHVGEAKTTVKGFFGQPLAGLPTASLGSASGSASSGFGASGSTTSTFGNNSFGGNSSGSGTTGSGTSGSGATGTTGTDSGTSGTSGTSGASGTNTGGISSQSATSFTGGGAPIMGVGLTQSGASTLIVNEQTQYNDWEFLYDPRIEQLKAKANLLGGGPPSSSTGSLGSASGMSSGTNGSSNGTSSSGSGTSTPTTGTGTSGTTPQ
ncbi:hypothetical protein SAMN05421770_10660 [Granulicella rosea]|uniref:Type II secretory pathway, pseudopilin PulG n=1 Tax=Granulicella rosea TaxID=474952 RepID=A0A239L2T5_9BACT|nr:type II secretion system protein [Granulicella rosea]SNT24630.1 hypothetical protein SAMN05421770_10660 [Granulicella rosea]